MDDIANYATHAAIVFLLDFPGRTFNPWRYECRPTTLP